ncbi:hypothetical protein M271_39335 [Streptomyces rapamycinicus NRRL 5491]|nr:hypothetical protein M271_39335 [Streptomyces rapamycinicus NRRL 5491]
MLDVGRISEDVEGLLGARRLWCWWPGAGQMRWRTHMRTWRRPGRERSDTCWLW